MDWASGHASEPLGARGGVDGGGVGDNDYIGRGREGFTGGQDGDAAIAAAGPGEAVVGDGEDE